MSGELGSGTPVLAGSPGLKRGSAPSAWFLVAVGKRETHHFQERVRTVGICPSSCHFHTHCSYRTSVPWGGPRSWLNPQTPGFDKAKSDGASPLPPDLELPCGVCTLTGKSPSTHGSVLEWGTASAPSWALVMCFGEEKGEVPVGHHLHTEALSQVGS